MLIRPATKHQSATNLCSPYAPSNILLSSRLLSSLDSRRYTTSARPPQRPDRVSRPRLDARSDLPDIIHLNPPRRPHALLLSRTRIRIEAAWRRRTHAAPAGGNDPTIRQEVKAPSRLRRVAASRGAAIRSCSTRCLRAQRGRCRYLRRRNGPARSRPARQADLASGRAEFVQQLRHSPPPRSRHHSRRACHRDRQARVKQPTTEEG